MEIYLLRHAIAAPRTGLGDDSKRPLTRKGADKMRRIAKGMRRLKLDFDLVLSSPYLRAKQTAEIAAAELGASSCLRFSPHLVPLGNARRLIAELLRGHASRKSVLLVGHEPYLSTLVSTLLAGYGNVPIVMKKGGLCKLTTRSLRHGACAQLEWLLTPRQLVRIGRT